MFGLFSGAINAVKSALGLNKPAPKPAPKPAAPKPAPYQKLAPLPSLPKIDWYIPTWEETQSGKFNTAAQARMQAQIAATGRVSGQISSTLSANQRAMQENAARLQREAAERERKRREKQAALDQTFATLKKDRTQRAQKALDQMAKKSGGTMLSWRSYLNDDGTIKAKGQKVDGFEIPENWYNETGTIQWAKSEWSKWYNSDAGVYQKSKDEYRKKAEQIIANNEKANGGGFWNWLTGANKENSRKLAQQQLDDLNKNQTKRYDDKLNKFLTEQAKKKAAIEQAKFSSRAEFDKAVKEFSDWENSNIKDLEYMRGASAGMSEGYGKKASEENTSPAGKVGSWFNKNVVNGLPGQAVGGLWKYTLGEGDENVPSLVTAPMRAINSIGNAVDQNRQINQYGNKSQKGLQGKNPWQASFNQRNWNIGNAKDYSRETDIESSYQDALRIYKNQKKPSQFSQWYKDKLPTKQQWLNEEMYDYSTGRPVKSGGTTREMATWGGQNGENRKQIAGMTTDTLEFLSDPMLYVGGLGLPGKLGKGASWTADALKATKAGSKVWSATEKIAKSKPVQWLNKEYKTPDQEFSDALKIEKQGGDELNRTVGARINAINQKLAGKDRIDTKILDDLKGLTDREAAILQRMVNGKFGTFADRMAMRDIRGLQYVGQAQRDKLLDISRRWNDFTEKMKLSDEVTKTGWGGKNRTYSPYIDYTGDHTADNYNFFARKKNTKRIQLAEDLARNAETRYLKSNLGADLKRQAGESRAAWMARREALIGEYDTRFNKLIEPVKAANAKRGTISRYIKQRAAGVDPTTSLGRSVFNTARNTAGLPMKVWKQSVLKYRPAWTVNNVLYNTQGAALAGGSRALVEQARMMKPKNWRAAMSEVPDSVKADLTGEMGKGKLNKFYNGVENWSRVAAFRAAKADGLTDQQALKRVNKYLFDYKTKNWERPLRGVMPFWSWNKSLAKAAVNMPFDRPAAAMGYHRVGQYQQDQFDAEFEQVVPELTKLGYTEDEIQQIKEEQSKYYRGRLKVGNQWITTPFNAFSEKGLTGLGFNPYLAALGESATATDSFGRPLRGDESTFAARVGSKFPQLELGKKAYNSWRVATKADKPVKGWIGEKGSEGYGLTKERQGYDPSKPNYDRSMDPRAKLGQDALAFVGVPRGLEFDTRKLVTAKKLQKMTDEYFALDTKNMDYPAAEAAREAVFKKYGMSADDFYKGVLSKYDTDNTKQIKGKKEAAAAANKSLFEEYAAQPAGTRNMWATEKLRQLNAAGYFNDNPFLKSFDWITPDTVGKADRQAAYLDAKRTGNWDKWRATYGDTRKPSAKKLAYDKAKASGDWSAYRKAYGTTTKQTPYQYDGKYFKSAESMKRYRDGQFWAKYAAADRSERKKLLADNPQYNERSDWTDEMWNRWKSDKKRKQVEKARSWGNFASRQDANTAAAKTKAGLFLAKRSAGRSKRLTWG